MTHKSCPRFPSRFVSNDLLFNQYLQEARKHKPLTPTDEKTLTRLARQGDQRAKEQLALANLRFVISQAKNYTHLGLPLMDLIQAGNIGLIKAIEKFEPEYGFRFTTYASYWVTESIQQALVRDSRLIRLPKNQIENANKVKKLEAKLQKGLERKPDEAEIAEQDSSLSPRQIRLTQFFMRSGKPISLDASVLDGNELCLGDCLELPNALSPLEMLCQKDLDRQLEKSLSILTERERQVVLMFFGLNEKKAGRLPK